MQKIKKYNRSNEVDSLKHKLTSYAALAGTFVALSPEVNAQCPTTANIVLDDSGEFYEVDFDNDGTIDVTIGFFSTQGSYVLQSYSRNDVVTGFTSNPPIFYQYFAYINYTSYFYYSNLAFGYVIPGAGNGVLGTGFLASVAAGSIGSGGPFQTNTQYINYVSSKAYYYFYYYYQYNFLYYPASSNIVITAPNGPYGPATLFVFSTAFPGGNFAGGGGEHIGVEFVGGDGETHYGWVELAVDPVTAAVTVVSHAYNCQGLESADAPTDAAVTAGVCPPPCVSCSANVGTFPANN